MPRKKGPRIVEENRKWLKDMGAIDDRYKNPLEGMIVKEQREYEPKKK